MANSTAHLLASVEGCGALFAAGQLQFNGTTSVLTLTRLSSPVFFQGDITAYRLGAGRYQVNVANFRGPIGIVVPQVTVGSSSTVAAAGAGAAINMVPMSSAITAGSYVTSTDTYGFVIGVTSGNTFTDADCYFTAYAF